MLAKFSRRDLAKLAGPTAAGARAAENETPVSADRHPPAPYGSSSVSQ
jgi:hypothetical protein